MAPSLGPHPQASHASLRQRVLISPVSHWGTGRQQRCRGQPAHSRPSSLLGCKAVRESGPQCPGVCLRSHFHRWQGTSSLEPPGLNSHRGIREMKVQVRLATKCLDGGAGGPPPAPFSLMLS